MIAAIGPSASMQLDWERLFKRYVLDDVRTPYFTAVDHLTRTQAHYELRLYVALMGVLFAVIALFALSPDLPHRGAPIVSLYAASVALVAVAFGIAKHPWAAAYCAGAPIAALLYFLLYGFHPNLGPWDKTLIIVLVLIWTRYSWRVLAIVRAYPDMQ
jgi:hypothetical protein